MDKIEPKTSPSTLVEPPFSAVKLTNVELPGPTAGGLLPHRSSLELIIVRARTLQPLGPSTSGGPFSLPELLPRYIHILGGPRDARRRRRRRAVYCCPPIGCAAL